MGRRNSICVDEGINSWNLLAMKMKACNAVVRRGEKSLLSDPGSELRLEREKEKGKVAR